MRDACMCFRSVAHHPPRYVCVKARVVSFRSKRQMSSIPFEERKTRKEDISDIHIGECGLGKIKGFPPGK